MAEGFLPEAMVNYLMLLGWGPGDDQEILPYEELEQRFRIEDVGTSPAFFNVEADRLLRRAHASPNPEAVRGGVRALAVGSVRAVAAGGVRLGRLPEGGAPGSDAVGAAL
ncbi:hypothetical protein ACFRK5_00160 [Streptomyces niveus]|uniref:hypothetical protein n=1 Tax=Streptomyces niveus TaxID=193462 RepID=UPI0036B28892